MSYVIMVKGDVISFASLSELDVLSVVISAVCHDYGHDGFNNAYHVNAISERAIRYSDQSV
jgi:high affinity cGMP-specific 3',5'-cyclic phosphodiesterase 9